MPGIQGQKVGQWDGNFGKTDLKIKEKLKGEYTLQIDAHKAIVKTGETGTIVKAPNSDKDRHESVYFTYTLNPDTLKGKYHKLSIGMLNGALQKDEVASLQNKGFTVVVDKTATVEMLLINGGKSLSFGHILTKPGLSTVLNPFAWKGETLQQAFDKHLK